MRVVAFGYQTWGYRTLEGLLGAGHQVPLVVTHPDSDNAYETIWNDSVAELARKNDIPVLERVYPNDDEIIERLTGLAPDIIVAVNWRAWISPEVFGIPKYGTLNVHDALLPAYAGFAPLNWALINGEPEVGVTAHIMDEEFDAGDIVRQEAVPVGDRDTAADLFEKTLPLFETLPLEALELIEAGRTGFVKQDRSKASYFHRRSTEDSRIDWTWQADEIDRLIRAQSDPYPNAFAFHNGRRLRILAASVTGRAYGGTPGRIFIRDGSGVVIVAGADARRGRNPGLRVERVRTEDGADLPALEYFTSMGGYLTSYPDR